MAERPQLGSRDVRRYRALRVETAHERQKVRSRRNRRNVRRQASNHVHERTTQRSEGDPELRPGGVVEPRWRDADDPVLELCIRIGKRASDDPGIPAELALPRPVAKYDGRGGAGHVVVGPQQATERRTCAEQLEEVARDDRPIEHDRPVTVQEGMR